MDGDTEPKNRSGKAYLTQRLDHIFPLVVVHEYGKGQGAEFADTGGWLVRLCGPRPIGWLDNEQRGQEGGRNQERGRSSTYNCLHMPHGDAISPAMRTRR